MPLRWCIFHGKAKFANTKHFFQRYPLLRGMLTYSVIWPTGVILEEKFIRKKNSLDWNKVFRYGLFGSLYVAPTLYFWLSIAKRRWPNNTLNHSMKKALIEQVTYTPLAMSSFYFGMSLLEGQSPDEGLKEITDKFWRTYPVGCVYWPCAQMINYTYVAEKNRVPFVSFCSLIWSMFLAYMKNI